MSEWRPTRLAILRRAVPPCCGACLATGATMGRGDALVAGGETFASGSDGRVLTRGGGGLAEAVLLAGALALAAETARAPADTAAERSVDRAPPH